MSRLLAHHNAMQHLHPHNHQHSYVADAANLATRTIVEISSMVRRDDTTSSSTCAPDNTSAICAKPTNTSSGLIIGIAAAVPCTIAIVVLYLLHRRVHRKQRIEDANDPHKSLDFGMDDVVSSGKSRKGMPEMTVTDPSKILRPGARRNLSMDLSSPYLLPGNLQDSHESFRSMSRSSDHDDPYRPVNLIKEDPTYPSSRSSRARTDKDSTYTGSSDRSGENQRLVQNASRMSRTLPPDFHAPHMQQSDSVYSMPPARGQSLAQPSNPSDRWYPRDDKRYGSESPPEDFIHPAAPQDLLSNTPVMPPFPMPVQRTHEQYHYDSEAHNPYMNEYDQVRDTSNHGLQITVPSPTHDRRLPKSPASTLPPLPVVEEPPQVPRHDNNALQPVPQDNRRVSAIMGLRPLPPDDPTDNPEQRANRIRSFYKEYFDDSKPNPAGNYPQYDPQGDDYYADFLDDGAIYDPETGAFYTQPTQQYAEPISRRAMTPPPRGLASPFAKGHRSAASTQSARRPMAPPKEIIPPKALQDLPTPHMLKDDMLTFSPIDFAPPTTYRDRQLGRAPGSPTGSARPYSPAFKAHSPLVRSFDDLAVMPSPHALRISGTFTALDFAAQPRFRGLTENASDAGSIRSNRSGISAMQQNAIRAGAYRISRLPKEMVGTSVDLESTLKPTWDMRK